MLSAHLGDITATMPDLVRPTVLVHASFLAAMDEFGDEKRGTASDLTAIGHEMRTFARSWATPTGFATYVSWLLEQAQEDAPRPDGYVTSTNLWLVEGRDYLGRVGVRHRLTEQLLQAGGHIGYDVRPSARRRGHAGAMLAGALSVARGLGIGPALVTCRVDNLASRRVIERNGGVLEDQRAGKLRFWVPTAVTIPQ
jgi:predicted acetyltransferase